ncbi:hypothetical protein [Petroclostridium sp. X23]|nr:hypothetical protein [Petroclostridium sp. X23]WHH58447.1 hypothetical protein QKW49_22040 [Petroclostridium sp. X23]
MSILLGEVFSILMFGGVCFVLGWTVKEVWESIGSIKRKADQ